MVLDTMVYNRSSNTSLLVKKRPYGVSLVKIDFHFGAIDYSKKVMGMFGFGKRKIVGMHYTRYIALPQVWLTHHGLGKGDEVELFLNDSGCLILQPAKKRRTRPGR
jgi:hypothetical protein